MTTTTRAVELTHEGRTPLGPDSFRVVSRDLRPPAADEVVVEVAYAALEPSHRIRMRAEGAGFVPPAGVVGRVVASGSDRFVVGDVVTAPGAWAEHVVVPASTAAAYEQPVGTDLHHAVGLLGLTGLTAHHGVTRVVDPQPGRKVVVTGAYGGVGQVACQLLLDRGADVLGLAGGSEKVAALGSMGVRALDHGDDGWRGELDRWAPDGVDVLFDNVWTAASARVVERLRPGGRVALCGQMSGIESPAVGPLPLDDWFRLVTRSLTIQGFKAVDHAAHDAEARADLARLVAAGRLRQQVHLVDGWDAVPQAFCDLLAGRTHGKLVVEVAA